MAAPVFWSFVLFAAAVAASCGAMPHVRSSAARAARAARAAERGYVRSVSQGSKLIAVQSAVAPRVRVMAAAVEEHRRLDVLSGRPHHHLSLAAVAARPALSTARACMPLRACFWRLRAPPREKDAYIESSQNIVVVSATKNIIYNGSSIFLTWSQYLYIPAFTQQTSEQKKI